MEHATTADFEQKVINAKGLVVVDFWAEWCGPCKRFGPIFEEIAKTHGTKAKFVKVDVEAAEDVASQLGVQSIPTTMLFKDGQPVFEIAGLLSKDQLVQLIAQHS